MATEQSADYIDGIHTDIPGFGPEVVEQGARRLLQAWMAGNQLANGPLVVSIQKTWDPAYMGRFEDVWPSEDRPKVLDLMRKRAEHLRDNDPNWRTYAFHGQTEF